MFLGGTGYSVRTGAGDYESLGEGVILGAVGSASQKLYPARRHLNLAAFGHGDAAAVEHLQNRSRVSYLLVDRVNGFPTDPRQLRRLGDVVYANLDAVVIRLRGTSGSD